MAAILLLAFIVVPIVELAVIGAVSRSIGLGWTLAVLFLDSVVGAVLVRHEGRRAWAAFRRALSEARWPGDEVAQGGLLLVGGALLLTPGFVTDVVGLLLVLPVTRRPVAAALRTWMTPGPVRSVFGSREGGGSRRPGRDDDGTVLDVEVISVEREEDGGGHGPGGQSGGGAEPGGRPGPGGTAPPTGR